MWVRSIMPWKDTNWTAFATASIWAVTLEIGFSARDRKSSLVRLTKEWVWTVAILLPSNQRHFRCGKDSKQFFVSAFALFFLRSSFITFRGRTWWHNCTNPLPLREKNLTFGKSAKNKGLIKRWEWWIETEINKLLPIACASTSLKFVHPIANAKHSHFMGQWTDCNSHQISSSPCGQSFWPSQTLPKCMQEESWPHLNIFTQTLSELHTGW